MKNSDDKWVIDIGIPIDLTKLLDSKLLIQASSGYGKSRTIRKLSETISGKVQQILLDREGDFVSLRERFDFALISVDGGDIPLSVRYAEMIAVKLMETRMSAVIDLYDLKTDERVTFVKRFCNALINIPKTLWHPCLVYIDEAQLFCPEGKTSESADAVINLCSLGRKRGIGVVLATQRLSKLNKDATADCMNKLIGATGQDLDRKRASDELGFNSKADTLNLRNLDRGEFYAFGPAISREVVKFKVGPVVTTHPSSDGRLVEIPPTPKAIKKIVATLADIPKEAEKELETKQQLHAEVNRLKHELRLAKAASTISKKVEPLVNQKSAKLENDIKRLENQLNEAVNQKSAIMAQNRELKKLLQANQKDFSVLNKSMGAAAKMMEGACAIALNGSVARDPKLIEAEIPLMREGRKYGEIAKENRTYDKPVLKIDETDNGVKNVSGRAIRPQWKPYNNQNFDADAVKILGIASGLNKCSRTILKLLATYPDKSFTLAQAGVMSGYSANSGGFGNSLSELKTAGLIVRDKGVIKLASGADVSGIVSVETQEYSIDTYRKKLSKCEREIYDVLLAEPDRIFSMQELADATPSKYSAGSGGFGNALSGLNTQGLINRSKGTVKLNPELLELLDLYQL